MDNKTRRLLYAQELKTYSDEKVLATLEDIKHLKRRLLGIERAVKRELLRREIASGKVC